VRKIETWNKIPIMDIDPYVLAVIVIGRWRITVAILEKLKWREEISEQGSK